MSLKRRVRQVDRAKMRQMPPLTSRIFVLLQWMRKVTPNPVWGIMVATFIAFSGRGELLLRSVGMLFIVFWLAIDFWNWLLTKHYGWRWMTIFGTSITNLMLIAMMGTMWWWMNGKLKDQQEDVYQHLNGNAFLQANGDVMMDSMFSFNNGGETDIAKHQMFCVPIVIVTPDRRQVDNRMRNLHLQFLRASDIPLKAGGDGESAPCLQLIGISPILCADVIVGIDYELSTQLDIKKRKEVRFVLDARTGTQWHQQGVDYRESYCPLFPQATN